LYGWKQNLLSFRTES